MDQNQFNTKEIKHVRAYIAADDKAIDDERRRINFVVSSEVVDRASEVVEAQAVFEAIHRKGEFVDNPICLACHLHRLDSGMPPAIGCWDVATAKLRGKRVEMVLQYDAELRLGAEYWTAYKNRTMRAVSIGFRVLDYRVEDRGGIRVFVATKIELIEISCVAVGCNKEALARIKGLAWLADIRQDDQTAPGSKAYWDAKFDELSRRIEALADATDDIHSLLVPGADEDRSIPDDRSQPSDADEAAADGQDQSKLLETTLENWVLEMENER